MKVLFVLAVVVFVALAENDVDKDAEEAAVRAEKRFSQWMVSKPSKRKNVDMVKYTNLCSANSLDCCAGNKCQHGSICNKADKEDSAIKAYGYKCIDDPNGQKSECGARPGKYVGVLCNVKYEDACKDCKELLKAEGKPFKYCMATTNTLSGEYCYGYEKGTDTWYFYGKKDLDEAYGQGAGEALELIATEEYETIMEKKREVDGQENNKLVRLLKALLASAHLD